MRRQQQQAAAASAAAGSSSISWGKNQIYEAHRTLASQTPQQRVARDHSIRGCAIAAGAVGLKADFDAAALQVVALHRLEGGEGDVGGGVVVVVVVVVVAVVAPAYLYGLQRVVLDVEHNESVTQALTRFFLSHDLHAAGKGGKVKHLRQSSCIAHELEVEKVWVALQGKVAGKNIAKTC
jgi:hypothetical protein